MSNPSGSPTPTSPDYAIHVIGAPRPPLKDFYHRLLRLSWTRTLLLVMGAYFVLNAAFAAGYTWAGGVAHARQGSFRDAFFFSVQTMGTIGYGAMYPEGDAANLLSVLESTVSLVFTALVTGLVFAKFSRPTARVAFSRYAALSPMNGRPTLSFRLGNVRENQLVEVSVRLTLVRTERTNEGGVFYRNVDLPLTRERISSLSRAWTVMHVVDEQSPLHAETPESLAESDAELLIAVAGVDDTWMQQVYAAHRYSHTDVAWGSRLADILREEGNLVILDMRRFHELEACKPSAGFPYPRA